MAGFTFVVESQTSGLLQKVYNTNIGTTGTMLNKSYTFVSVNGFHQVEGTDFTVTGSNQITLTNAPILAATVTIMTSMF